MASSPLQDEIGLFPAIDYKVGAFVPQMQYVWPGRLCTYKPFKFRFLNLRVSVQAGFHNRSTFRIDGKIMQYPFFFGDFGDFDDIYEMSHRDGLREHLLLECCTHFEVAIMPNSKDIDTNWIHPKAFGIKSHSDDGYWEKHGPGNFITKKTVNRILSKLHNLQEKERIKRFPHAAVIIQAAYRGWKLRKDVIENPHTPLGKKFLKFKVDRDIKDDAQILNYEE